MSLNRLNTKRSTNGRNDTSQRQGQILKAARENDPSLTRGKWLITPIKWKTVLTDALEARKQCAIIPKMLKEKKSVDQKSYIYNNVIFQK